MPHLIQVDDIELLAGDTVEHSAFIVQEDDLQGLELLGQLTGSDIGVDVQDLACVGFGQAGEDGEGTGPDGSLNGTLVDLCDLANETVLVLVEIIGGEDSGGDGACASAKLFKSGDELKVLVKENAAGNLQSLRVWDACDVLQQCRKRAKSRERTCYTDTVDVVRNDTGTLDDVVELGASTMEDDGVEANTVEEAEVEGELVYLVKDGTADLDDGELCGVGGI